MAGEAYDVLAEKLGWPGSKRFRLCLELLLTPLEAEVAALLPATADEIATKLGMPKGQVEDHIHRGYLKGAVFPTSKGYFLARSTGQLKDACLTDRRWDKELGPRLFAAWNDFAEQEGIPKRMGGQPRGGGGMAEGGLRVVPVLGALKGVAGVIPQEDIEILLGQCDAWATTPCSCRRQTMARPQGEACGKLQDVCVQVNRGADYVVKRGSGKQLTKDECLDVFAKSADAGLVITLPKRPKFSSICNCCDDCCTIFYTNKKYGQWDRLTKSRFASRVNLNDCNGCEVCMQRCPYDAIEMKEIAGHKTLKAIINEGRCLGCGVCVVGCAPEAMKLETVRPTSHVLQYYG